MAKTVDKLSIRVTARAKHAFYLLLEEVRKIKLQTGEIERPSDYRETDFLEEMLVLIAEKYGLVHILEQLGIPIRKRTIPGNAY